MAEASETSPLLRVEATVLLYATGLEPVTPRLGEILRDALTHADDWVWFSAMTRLAAEPKLQAELLHPLADALQSSGGIRRLLALQLLFQNPELGTALPEALVGCYLDRLTHVDEALAALRVLLPLRPASRRLRRWLRSLSASDNDLPLAAEFRRTLSIHKLTPMAPLNQLASLLRSNNAEACFAASLALLARDIEDTLIKVLIEAAQSADDRIRKRVEARLYATSGQLPTDGTTQAVSRLVQFLHQAETPPNPYLGTVAATAISSVVHEEPDLVAQWLEASYRHASPTSEEACAALAYLSHASSQVLSLLCTALVDPDRSPDGRYAVLSAFLQMLKENNQRENKELLEAVTKAVADSEVAIARKAAYILQLAAGTSAWDVARALLEVAKNPKDGRTGIEALRSAGRVLRTIHGYRDVDWSKGALFGWLQRRSQENFDFRYLTDYVDKLPQLASLVNVANPAEIFKVFSFPEKFQLPRIPDAAAWKKLIADAQQEWTARQYWAERLPGLPRAIAELDRFLADSDPKFRRAGATARAKLFLGDAEFIAVNERVAEDSDLLPGLMDACIDHDRWVDDGDGVSHHPGAVRQLADWIVARSPEEVGRKIDGILNDLDRNAASQAPDGDDDQFYGWAKRRVYLALLAELSERLTFRAFTGQRSLESAAALFARFGADLNDFDTRRFAVRVLGNLQLMTEQVADVFFAACQDVDAVYRETRTAVKKFKAFGRGSLERLTAGVSHPSVTVAYNASVLLGELGLSRSEDLGPERRKLVAGELMRLLAEPLSERVVYDFSQTYFGEEVGPLYDVIYEALMRVVSGPDAQVSRISAE